MRLTPVTADNPAPKFSILTCTKSTALASANAATSSSVLHHSSATSWTGIFRTSRDVRRVLSVLSGHAGGGLAVLARRAPVDVGLEDGGVEHGETSDKETGVDTLDGCEVDTAATEEGVDELVEDGDEDDDGNGVQVSIA